MVRLRQCTSTPHVAPETHTRSDWWMNKYAQYDWSRNSLHCIDPCRPLAKSVNVSVGEGNHTLYLRAPRWLAAPAMARESFMTGPRMPGNIFVVMSHLNADRDGLRWVRQCDHEMVRPAGILFTHRPPASWVAFGNFPELHACHESLCHALHRFDCDSWP